MRILKGCVFNEHGRLNIDSIDKTHIVVDGVEAKPGDICLLIGQNNDRQDVMLEGIEESGIASSGRIYDLTFDDLSVKISVIHTLPCKFFGVYE